MASSLTSYGTIPSPNGVDLFYEREGNPSGPSILFIHGLGGTTNAYQPLVSALQDYDLIRYDWAGHGRSAVPKKMSLEAYAQDALAVIQHFNLTSVTIVAHSLGCLIASHVAAHSPDLIQNLILLGPIKTPPAAAASGPRDRATTVRASGMAKVADTIVTNAFSAHSLKNKTEIVAFAREMLTRQDPYGYALACDALANGPDPEWTSVKAKTVIVGGEEDKVAKPEVCDAVAGLLTKVEGKVEVLRWKDVGHWYMLENVAGCVEVVRGVVGGGKSNGVKV